MTRRAAPRVVDPQTGEIQLAAQDPVRVRQELYAEHKALLRASKLLRELVLVSEDPRNETQISDRHPATIQMALIARDRWRSEANAFVAQGYFRLMMKLVQDEREAVSSAIEAMAERDLRDRHHADKMSTLKGAGAPGSVNLRTLIERAMGDSEPIVIEDETDHAAHG